MKFEYEGGVERVLLEELSCISASSAFVSVSVRLLHPLDSHHGSDSRREWDHVALKDVALPLNRDPSSDVAENRHQQHG